MRTTANATDTATLPSHAMPYQNILCDLLKKEYVLYVFTFLLLQAKTLAIRILRNICQLN